MENERSFFVIEAADCPNDLFIGKTHSVMLDMVNFVYLDDQKDGNKEWCNVICKKDKTYFVTLQEAERIAKELCAQY